MILHKLYRVARHHNDDAELNNTVIGVMNSIRDWFAVWTAAIKGRKK